MRTVTYSESRAKYAETLNAVVDDREEVIIIRAGHENRWSSLRSMTTSAPGQR
jgi:PHD/YefM family antitoxin component YafN of YafNO toxin-antitoxin module